MSISRGCGLSAFQFPCPCILSSGIEITNLRHFLIIIYGIEEWKHYPLTPYIQFWFFAHKLNNSKITVVHYRSNRMTILQGCSKHNHSRLSLIKALILSEQKVNTEERLYYLMLLTLILRWKILLRYNIIK